MILGYKYTDPIIINIDRIAAVIKFKESFGCKGSMRIAYEKEFSVEF